MVEQVVSLHRLLLLAGIVVLTACTATSAQPVATPAPSFATASGVATAPAPTATAMPAAPAPPTLTPTTLPLTATATATPPLPTVTPLPPPARFGLPIGRAGQLPGDGFFLRHGYAVENTWFNPGYWHTGEDWYAVSGESAGAAVYAVAGGTVEYVGANYPGRVVIVRHAADLYSMYGHLDPAVDVAGGQEVARGDRLGTVLRRSDTVPNHLHFELRTFLISEPVNGARPRYPFRCGVNCPPGPGYWPIDAPDHPSDMGWRNPTHMIAARLFPANASGLLGQVVVVSEPFAATTTLWSAPPDTAGTAQPLGELALEAGNRYPLLAVYHGPPDSRATGAAGYLLWYQIGLADGNSAWVQAAVADDFETGSDGRPATIWIDFLVVQ